MQLLEAVWLLLRVLSVSAIVLILGAYFWPGSPLKKWLEAWIDQQVAAKFAREADTFRAGLQRDADTFRHTLGMEADRHRWHLEGQQHGLTLLTNKRVEVYAELYKRMLQADSEIGALSGLQIVSAYRDYGVEDVSRLLDSWTVTSTDREAILSIWKSNQSEAIKVLRDVERRVSIANARELYREAWSYFLLNSLYLDDNLENAAGKVFELHRKSLAYYLLPVSSADGVALTRLKEEAAELLERLRKALRGEVWGTAGLLLPPTLTLVQQQASSPTAHSSKEG